MEELPFLGREQLVAPGDRLSQRLLPALDVVKSLPEHLERAGLRQPLEHRARRISPDPGRRELDRQREAIETLTEREDVAGILVRQLEAG